MKQIEDQPIVSVTRLVKKYRHFQLGPLDFELARGRAYGLLGANGAGKTTLLNCLAGQSRSSGGQIFWGRQRVGWGDWRLREQISFVPERPVLYDELRISQVLKLASRVFRFWNEEFARTWLDKMDLDERRKVRELSKGMKVKLSLILGLSHQAELLLLDEPTAGLDPESRADLQEFLKQVMVEKSATILISSHLFEDIELVADELKIIQQGRIVFERSLSDLKRMKIFTLAGRQAEAISDNPSVVLQWERNGDRQLLVDCAGRGSAVFLRTLSPAVSSKNATIQDIYFGVRRER